MKKHHLGLTLIELLATLTIVALLASIAVPVTEVVIQRQKEQELRLALREIRRAIDAYKLASDNGHILKPMNASGYPASLEDLVDGVQDAKDPRGRKLYFLRRLPPDPMHQNNSATPSETWGKRSYASGPDDPQEGEDVYDVRSLSPRVGLNGIPYAAW